MFDAPNEVTHDNQGLDSSLLNENKEDYFRDIELLEDPDEDLLSDMDIGNGRHGNFDSSLFMSEGCILDDDELTELQSSNTEGAHREEVTESSNNIKSEETSKSKRSEMSKGRVISCRHFFIGIYNTNLLVELSLIFIYFKIFGGELIHHELGVLCAVFCSQ